MKHRAGHGFFPSPAPPPPAEVSIWENTGFLTHGMGVTRAAEWQSEPPWAPHCGQLVVARRTLDPG